MYKKVVSVILTAIAILMLSSCGKSEAAKLVDELILEIGEVSLDSGEKISEVETAINALTQKEQKQLDNLGDFLEIKEEFEQLKIEKENEEKQLLVEEVEKLIGLIKKVSSGSGKIISRARKAYDELPQELQEMVENYSVLLSAEEEFFQREVAEIEKAIKGIGNVTRYSLSTIEEVRKKYDEADEEIKNAVSNYDLLLSAEEVCLELRLAYVEDLISKIGTVTLNSEGQIKAARNEYDDLTPKEKNKVSNRSVLINAESKLQSLKDAEVEKQYVAARDRMRTKVDKVEGITWYESTRQPYYANSRSYVFPYIGERGSSIWLRLKFLYTGDDWIFYEEIVVWIDGTTYRFDLDYDEVDRNSGSGDVWEVYDISPKNDDIEMLWEIINSQETIIRFDGDDGRRDITISAADKQGIKDVLIVYEYMKNH